MSTPPDAVSALVFSAAGAAADQTAANTTRVRTAAIRLMAHLRQEDGPIGVPCPEVLVKFTLRFPEIRARRLADVATVGTSRIGTERESIRNDSARKLGQSPAKEVVMLNRLVVPCACVVVLAGCGKAADSPSSLVPSSPTPLSASTSQVQAALTPAGGERLPFHSEVIWQVTQLPVPAGKCTREISGLALLWLSEISGTATSSHLGTGPYYAELCMYGILTDADAPPPANGIPMNWYVQTQMWTAANGDRLMATGELAGLTTPPDDPDLRFVENLRFLDGGTNRFEFVEGEGTGIVDPAGTAVYDGWIRYARKQKRTR